MCVCVSVLLICEANATHTTYNHPVQAIAVHAEAKSDPRHRINANLHFIAFVMKNKCVYELDGRKEFPINHGSTTSATFLKVSRYRCVGAVHGALCVSCSLY